MLGELFHKSFDWSGKAGRGEFLAVAVPFALLSAMVFWETIAGQAVPTLFWVALGTLALPFHSALVRRLHDTGRAGWWYLLVPLPVIGPLALLPLCLGRSDSAFRDYSAPSGLRSLGIVLVALAAALLVSRLFWYPLTVQTAQMKPAFLVGDVIVVPRIALAKPRRGEPWIAAHPVTGAPRIARVIGLPGDEVALSGGTLSLNGVPAGYRADGVFTETFRPEGPSGQAPLCSNPPVGLGGTCRKHRLIETLPGGQSYPVLDTGPGVSDRMAPVRVPEDHVFLLFDNRDAPGDSRFPQSGGGLGMVPAEELMAPVRRVLVSTDRPGAWRFWAWRHDRLLKAVR